MSCAAQFEQSVTDGHQGAEGEQAHGQNSTQRGLVLISPYKDRSSLLRQPWQKVKLNTKVVVVGNSVHLHLNVFDLPSSKALRRQIGCSNGAQLQVYVFAFSFNTWVTPA